MYNFFVDLFIWTFAIFGMTKVIEEFAIDIICIIVKPFYLMNCVLKKCIAKFCAWIYNYSKGTKERIEKWR